MGFHVARGWFRGFRAGQGDGCLSRVTSDAGIDGQYSSSLVTRQRWSVELVRWTFEMSVIPLTGQGFICIHDAKTYTMMIEKPIVGP